MEETTQISAKELAEVLKSSKNIILHGAPGTGKTHLAREIAKYLIDPNYDPKNPSIADDDTRIGFVQFHPSYDYTDFVEGLRPVNEENDEIDDLIDETVDEDIEEENKSDKIKQNNQVVFKRKDGIFKEFCKNFAEFDLKTASQYVYSLKIAKGLKNMPISADCSDKLRQIKDGFFRNDLSTVIEIFLINFINNNKAEKIKLTGYASETEYEVTIPESVYGNWNSTVKIPENSEYYNRYPVYYADCGKIIPKLKALIRDGKIKDKPSESYYVATDIAKYIIDQKQKGACVFIIDEINRGEISKIFGELFYLIDPDKRGEKHKLKTQYQNLVEDGDIFSAGFYIPENVYIIATMNDIDRSVEPIDFAFRRRFTWINVKASETQEAILKELNGIDENLKKAAKNKMDALNSKISKIDGLDENYHIGASYFLKLKNLENDFDKLWGYHLEPLLREYLSGRPKNEIEQVMANLKDAYENPENYLPEQNNSDKDKDKNSNENNA